MYNFDNFMCNSVCRFSAIQRSALAERTHFSLTDRIGHLILFFKVNLNKLDLL